MPTEPGTEGKWLQLAGKKNRKVHALSKRTDTSQPKPTAAMGSVVQEQREQPALPGTWDNLGATPARPI